MPNKRRRLTGRVVSNKMDKTVVVEVQRTYRHRLYGKVVKSSKRFMAHDENNACEIGDQVVIVESRPLSRRKRWVVQTILREDLSARTTDLSELEEATLASTAAEELEAAEPGEDE